MTTRGTAALLFSILLGAPAGADVLTVGPGGDHATLAAAVGAASDGDLLIVLDDLPSTEPVVLVDGMSLTIAGAGPTPPSVWTEGLWVENLAAGQTVTLWNLDVFGTGPTPTALVVRNSAGSVRVGASVFFAAGGSGRNAVWTTNSADVALGDCRATGGYGADFGTNTTGGAALFARNSLVAVHGGKYTGGGGGVVVTEWDWDIWCYCYVPDCWTGYEAGDGIETPDATLFVQGATVEGGYGGDAACWQSHCADTPGPGGDGVHLEGDPAASVELVGNVLVPGTGGTAYGAYCSGKAPDGTALAVIDGSAVTYPGQARRLIGGGIVAGGATLDLTLAGEPGDRAYLYLSKTAARTDHPLFLGPLLVGAPIIRRFLVGTIPAGGSLDVSLPTPPLGPGEANRTWFVQGVFVDGANQARAADVVPWITGS